MATRWLETDSLSNQNISSPLAVGAYTADADRWIAAQVFADQVAGNGDYYLYLTLQINGAGSSYKSGITTLTAASGVTAIFGQTVYIFVRSGDIVTAYLDGLAGDTTTPDTIVRWAELDALRPTTADRTLDVSATGEAGLDFDNIKQATGATTLTNITVPVVSAVTGLTASNLDATVSSRLASASYSAPPASSAIADAVWDEALSGHTTAGTAGKALSDAGSAGDPWSAAVRTLTQTAAQAASAIDGTEITLYRDATNTFNLTGLSDFTGYTRIWFTCKDDIENQPDAAANIHLMKSTTDLDQSGDGLVYLNGAAATLSDGSITVNSSTSITVTVNASASASLPLRRGVAYGVKALIGTDVRPVSEGGALNILPTAARAVS